LITTRANIEVKTHQIRSRKGRSDTTSDVKTCKRVKIIEVERVVAWSQHLYVD